MGIHCSSTTKKKKEAQKLQETLTLRIEIVLQKISIQPDISRPNEALDYEVFFQEINEKKGQLFSFKNKDMFWKGNIENELNHFSFDFQTDKKLRVNS